MADVVGPTDLRQRLAGCPSQNGFLPLMGCKFELATEPHPSRLRPLPSLVRPSLDQLALELPDGSLRVAFVASWWQEGLRLQRPEPHAVSAKAVTKSFPIEYR